MEPGNPQPPSSNEKDVPKGQEPDPQAPHPKGSAPRGIGPGPGPAGAAGTGQPWYHQGLRFACTQCGRCCQNHGEYEYLYLTTSDVQAMAAELGLSEAAFRNRYTAPSDGWTILRVEGPQCTFLTPEGQCSVYEARPMQCRTWPFWHENLTREAWTGPVQTICPGLNQGPLHSREEVERIADANETWYATDGGHEPETETS